MTPYPFFVGGVASGDDHFEYGEADEYGVYHDFVEHLNTLLEGQLVVEGLVSVAGAHFEEPPVDFHFDAVAEVAYG